MIEGNGFTIDEKKFDFFFGRVTSNPHNSMRSRHNAETLKKLGINELDQGKENLLDIFKQGLKAIEIDRIPRSYGIVIVRKVEITYQKTKGAIEISYFYLNGDLTLIPNVVTIIPKIYPSNQHENTQNDRKRI